MNKRDEAGAAPEQLPAPGRRPERGAEPERGLEAERGAEPAGRLGAGRAGRRRAVPESAGEREARYAQAFANGGSVVVGGTICTSPEELREELGEDLPEAQPKTRAEA